MPRILYVSDYNTENYMLTLKDVETKEELSLSLGKLWLHLTQRLEQNNDRGSDNLTDTGFTLGITIEGTDYWEVDTDYVLGVDFLYLGIQTASEEELQKMPDLTEDDIDTLYDECFELGASVCVEIQPPDVMKQVEELIILCKRDRFRTQLVNVAVNGYINLKVCGANWVVCTDTNVGIVPNYVTHFLRYTDNGLNETLCLPKSVRYVPDNWLSVSNFRYYDKPLSTIKFMGDLEYLGLYLLLFAVFGLEPRRYTIYLPKNIDKINFVNYISDKGNLKLVIPPALHEKLNNSQETKNYISKIECDVREWNISNR